MDPNLNINAAPPVRKTILIVEDDATTRESLSFVLNSAGYETLAASDGAPAIGILRTRPVDLILLDIGMPGMDGLTFLKHLRAEPTCRTVRVIMLTGAEARREVLEAARYGVREYLIKSRFSLKEFLSRVRHQPCDPTPLPAAAIDAAA